MPLGAAGIVRLDPDADLFTADPCLAMLAVFCSAQLAGVPPHHCVLVLCYFERAGACRRQEIVFIGAGMDEAAISKQLDQALLTDAEMGEYDARYKHVSGLTQL